MCSEPTALSWLTPKHQLETGPRAARPGPCLWPGRGSLVYGGDNARLGTGGTVPHTPSPCLRQAPVINYGCIILNRGGLLESPVNQA